MYEKKFRVSKGPERSVSLIFRNKMGGIDGHLIRPEHAVEMARDLLETAHEVADIPKSWPSS